MLMLALTCVRSRGVEDEVLNMVLKGQVADALRCGIDRLERPWTNTALLPQRAAFGQVLGRLLLAAGREEEAEELFRKQLRLYESVSRSYVRWMSSLDQGAMFLSLNKLGRASEAFNMVADDDSAPTELRIEALSGLTIALHSFGEYRRATRTLSHGMELARQGGLANRLPLLDALRLELAAKRMLRSFEEGSDPTLGEIGTAWDATQADDLQIQLESTAMSLDDMPLAAHRLRFLCTLMDKRVASPEVAANILDALKWLRDRKLAGHEKVARVEAALAFVNHADSRTAQEVLGTLAHDEVQVRRHRHALELKYCISKLHALHGRHVDALRVYKEHAAHSLMRLRMELAQVPYSRFLEKQEMAEHTDATKLQLPLRYRKAYQFIIEHLNDRDLSIRQVAAHIDVTERALQMAFRTHLGMTPAELIRRKRMEHIRNELRNGTQQDSVLEVASRWGMTNRSTLAQNYRQQFGETPTAMLRGRTSVDRHPAAPEAQ